MAGSLEVIEAGFANAIQDLGRYGYRHMGIAVSGCLDAMTARCANALAGNDSREACIEIRVLGPTLRLDQGRARIALAGPVTATLKRADGQCRSIPSWCSVTLSAQDELKVGSCQGGTAYLAISGGIDLPLQLGSRSTYMRAQIGGLDGRLLRKGNRFPVLASEALSASDVASDAWAQDDGPIRVILGPQDGHFAREAIEHFLSSEYTITPQMDRMGVRLEGLPLVHRTPESADIVSDGVTPGAIQVPANGQPIVLLADCQTVGGYPKIATVITADLPRFGQTKAGQRLRFAAVDLGQARQALQQREEDWSTWRNSLHTISPE